MCNRGCSVKWLLALLITVATVIVLSAQDLIVDVNLTMLNVSVEDQHGHPVLDLAADDFEVLENGQFRPVKHFSLQQEPVAIGFVVDRSSSVEPLRKDIDRAVERVLKVLRPEDKAFLITFAGNNSLNATLTNEPLAFLKTIQKTKFSFGTRFYDVIVDSLQYLATADIERKALVIFSDGADHYSSYTSEEVLGTAKRYGFPVYIFGYSGDDPSLWSEQGRRAVREEFTQLAKATHGKAFFPTPSTNCSELAKHILGTLGHTYKLGFYSLGPFTSLSDIQIRLRGHSSEEFTIRLSIDSVPISL